MADQNRKRSRKSRLVPRDLDWNPGLPEADQIPKRPKVLSKLNSAMAAAENPSSPPRAPSPPRVEFNVSIECEELPEDLEPRTDGCLINSELKLANDVLKEECEQTFETTTSLADKTLEIEMKNNWGRCFKVLKEDSLEDALQIALSSWRTWNCQAKIREVPLLYKCYTCGVGFWRFQPFKDHIRATHKNINIMYESFHHESCLIAWQGKSQRPKPIPVRMDEGNCPQCLEDGVKHISQHRESISYVCEGCSERFMICSKLFIHEGRCTRFLQHMIKCGHMIYENKYKCPICRCDCLTEHRYSSHMIGMHSPRNDQIISIPLYKICNFCGITYSHFPLHACFSKQLIHQCLYCFRRFPSKILVQMHEQNFNFPVRCRTCDHFIPRKCMEIEHVIQHSRTYAFAFQCMEYRCNTYSHLFPSEKTISHHLSETHARSKSEKRKGYKIMVVVPKTAEHLPEICDADIIPVEKNNWLKAATTSASTSKYKETPLAEGDMEGFELTSTIKIEEHDLAEERDANIAAIKRETENAVASLTSNETETALAAALNDETENALAALNDLDATENAALDETENSLAALNDLDATEYAIAALDDTETAIEALNDLDETENAMAALNEKETALAVLNETETALAAVEAEAAVAALQDETENAIAAIQGIEDNEAEFFMMEDEINYILKPKRRKITHEPQITKIKVEPVEPVEIEGQPMETEAMNNSDDDVMIIDDDDSTMIQTEKPKSARRDSIDSLEEECGEIEGQILEILNNKDVQAVEVVVNNEFVDNEVNTEEIDEECETIEEEIMGILNEQDVQAVEIHINHELEGNNDELEGNNDELEGNNHEVEVNNYELEGNNHEVEGNNHEVEGNNHEVEVNNYELEGNNHEVEGNNHEVEGNNHEVDGNNYELEGNNHELEDNSQDSGKYKEIREEKREDSIERECREMQEQIDSLLLKQKKSWSTKIQQIQVKQEKPDNDDECALIQEEIDSLIKQRENKLNDRKEQQDKLLETKRKSTELQSDDLEHEECVIERNIKIQSAINKKEKINIEIEASIEKFKDHQMKLKKLAPKPTKYENINTNKPGVNVKEENISESMLEIFEPNIEKTMSNVNFVANTGIDTQVQESRKASNILTSQNEINDNSPKDLLTKVVSLATNAISLENVKGEIIDPKDVLQDHDHDYVKSWTDTNMGDEMNDTNDQINDAKDQINDSNDQINDAKDQINDAKDRINDSKDHINDSNDQINDSKDLITASKDRISYLNDDSEDDDDIMIINNDNHNVVDLTELDNESSYDSSENGDLNLIIDESDLNDSKVTIKVEDTFENDEISGEDYNFDSKFNSILTNSKLENIRHQLQKFYKCKKCDFEGIHRDYNNHKQFCNMKLKAKRQKTAKITEEKLARIREKNRNEKQDILQKDYESPKNTKGPRFKCSTCDIAFRTMRKYLLHFCHLSYKEDEAKHTLEYGQCPKCHLILENVTKLCLHVVNHIKSSFIIKHSISSVDSASKTGKTEPLYKCHVCDEVVTYLDFFPHWESHLVSNDFVPSADRLPTVSESREDKVKKERPSLKDKLKPENLKKLLDQLQVPRDSSTFRPSIKMLKSCVQCNRTFDRRNDCKRHCIEHLLRDALFSKLVYGAFKCQICGEMSKKPDEYKQHMRAHGGLPIYKCELCNKDFSDSSNFTKHKKVHNVDVLICDICKRKFQAKFSLEKHMACHVGKEPLQCDQCERSFAMESALKKHKKNKHCNLDNKLRFSCIYCKLRFSSLRHKWDHLWEVHNERKDKADCPVCGSSFRKLNDVKRHLAHVHGINVQSSPERRQRLAPTLQPTPKPTPQPTPQPTPPPKKKPKPKNPAPKKQRNYPPKQPKPKLVTADQIIEQFRKSNMAAMEPISQQRTANDVIAEYTNSQMQPSTSKIIIKKENFESEIGANIISKESILSANIVMKKEYEPLATSFCDEFLQKTLSGATRCTVIAGNSGYPMPPLTPLPGKPTILPGKFSNLPGKSSTLPGTSSNLPGQSSILPGTSSNLPGTSSNLPGTSSSIPGKSSNIPGQSSTLPEKSSTLPGKSSNLPGKSTKPTLVYDGRRGRLGNLSTPLTDADLMIEVERARLKALNSKMQSSDRS